MVSAAKPEIGDYPFTTLVPNLGVVQYGSYQSFVMADIPGIIEGASEGRGLGLRFLRHIERNSNLLFLVDGSSEDPAGEYKTLLGELEKFNPELLDKNRLLAVTKGDLLEAADRKKIEKKLPKGIPYVFISSKTMTGIKELKDLIWRNLNDN